MLIFVASPLEAHEFWVEPLDFNLDKGAPMHALLKAGKKFVAMANYPLIPQRFKSFTITNAGHTVDYEGQVGDVPALQVARPQTGLNVLAYQSQPESLFYREPGALEAYLEAEGLGNVLDKHRADGLAEVGFSETYYRNAKSLVQVGPYSGGEDSALGLPFEMVVQGSPYVPGVEQVKVQLLWQGEPVANYPMNVFAKGASYQRTQILTDENGFATVQFPAATTLLLNSVWIHRTTNTSGVLYESWWASMTFGRN